MTLMKFLHISQVVATIVAYFFQLLGKPFVWLLGSCHGHMLCWDWSISVAQDTQAWSLTIWRVLSCATATVNMNQRALKKLVEPISKTVTSCKY